MRRPLLLLALAASGAFPARAFAATPAADDVARYAERLLRATYADGAGPGAAVLVARGDTVLYRGALGLDDIAAKDALTPDDRFRIGSVTKQFAAAAVLKLVEAGKVALDDPLAKFVPDYPNGANITVRQLLDHTSGVKSYTSLPGVMDGPIRKDVSTAELIATFKDESPDFAPGEGWSYNNSGYVLVGAVIEAASGRPWHDYLAQTFFAPLGMRDTGYGHDAAVVATQVRGWSLDGEKPVEAKPLSMTQPHAAGALVSTVDDLQRWNRALHEGKVLTPEHYALMTTPAGKAAELAKYGFGLFAGTLRNRPVLNHGGGIFGFSTMLEYVPGDDVSVVVLQNADASRPGQLDADGLAHRLAAVALGDPYPEAVPVAVDAEALKALEGVYRIDGEATRTLRVIDGVLTSQRSGGSPAKLVPIARDEFLFDDGFNRFTIERGGDGAVTGMRFFAMGEGEGEVAPRSDAPLPPLRTGIELPPAAIARVAGSYDGMGATLKVFVEDGVLMTQLTGQPALRLHAESPTRFFLTEVDATLEAAPAEGPVKTLTLHQGPATVEFVRQAP